MELSLLCDCNVMLIVTTEDKNHTSLYYSGLEQPSVKKYLSSVSSKKLKHNYSNKDVIYIYINKHTKYSIISIIS